MKDIVFSGVQPTRNLHIGNYIGALKQWAHIQQQHHCYFCIVDEHAITVPQDPKLLRERILTVAAVYLAAGIDPKRSILFIQSEVPQHTELGWLMMTVAKMGELERMTQYKDKSKKGGTVGAGVGLFGYPVLMAADILLYDTTIVPVGEDQLQHVELTRVLARRFNEKFGETFVVPQPLIQKIGARIMSLQKPDAKMSKSDESEMASIFLTDDNDTIRKKIMRAVTDSTTGVTFDPEKKPAVSNLMTIYHHMTGQTMKEIETAYEGKGYGDFKKGLAEAIITHMGPVRDKIEHYLSDPTSLNKILDSGRDKAAAVAEAKMKVVRERMGLGR
ncbi:MAG: tryptophan--tRNA ligase [Patescibacteria group bacterium]|nr:tryptophan--tRNA ligase [Patescibacteria group bacterium]